MDEQGIRKLYKYKLTPTSEQERELAFVARRVFALKMPSDAVLPSQERYCLNNRGCASEIC
jgi:hypothetical protein